MKEFEKVVCEVSILKKTSKNGNEYEGVFAILPNGKECFISFDKKVYYTIRKYGKE